MGYFAKLEKRGKRGWPILRDHPCHLPRMVPPLALSYTRRFGNENRKEKVRNRRKKEKREKEKERKKKENFSDKYCWISMLCCDLIQALSQFGF